MRNAGAGIHFFIFLCTFYFVVAKHVIKIPNSNLFKYWNVEHIHVRKKG